MSMTYYLFSLQKMHLVAYYTKGGMPWKKKRSYFIPEDKKKIQAHMRH